MLMVKVEFDVCSSRYTGALPREMKKEGPTLGIPGIYNTGGDVSMSIYKKRIE
jgi:hypothetical protein